MTDDADTGYGVIERDGDKFVARFERDFEHGQETVWAMLTEPDKLVQWLAPGTIELREGGAVKLDFVDSGIVIDSRVSAYDAPNLLEYSWSGPEEASRPLRWELAATPTGCSLTLTLTTPEDEVIDRSCAGWEAHLMMLSAALEGVPIKFPFEVFQASREAYKAQLGG